MCSLCLGSAGYLPSYQLGISGCIHGQGLRLIGVCFLATPQDGRWDCPHPKFLSRIHIRTPELGVLAGKEPEHLYICTVCGRMLRIHCGTMNRTAQGVAGPYFPFFVSDSILRTLEGGGLVGEYAQAIPFVWALLAVNSFLSGM